MALEKAKALEANIQETPDGPVKDALIEAQKGFLIIARKIAESANSTSISASAVISSALASAKSS